MTKEKKFEQKFEQLDPQGLQKLGEAMAAPIKDMLNRKSIGGMIPIPEGALPTFGLTEEEELVQRIANKSW